MATKGVCECAPDRSLPVLAPMFAPMRTTADEAADPTKERHCITHWYVFGRCG